MRYFIELSYNGTAYSGWQRQKNAPSVEQTLEQAMSALMGTTIELVGAGRTDAGVHASGYVAHFDYDGSVDRSLCYHLNSMLPFDIAVLDIYRVRDDAHARFDAVSRRYRYHIVTRKDPFRRATSWQYYIPLDIEAMNRAASRLLAYEDFTSFAKLGSDNKTNICHLSQAEWSAVSPTELVFSIRSDRFLRNMVRAVVGTLVDVGRGKLSVDDFCNIVESRDLSRSSSSAPASGLFLCDILYPESIKILK